MSALEDALVFQIRAAKLPAPMREFRFHPTRKWRADLAWPERRLLVEVEGGTWAATNTPGAIGRHSSGVGMRNDCQKYNAATLLGFRVIRVTPDMIRDGTALDVIERALREPT